MNQDYNYLTVVELKNLARQNGLSGYSRLNRTDLISLLQQLPVSLSNPKISQRALSETSLALLPRDMQLELLIQVDLPELQNICISNKQFRQLCQEEQFWELKVRKDFPNRPKGDLTWKENYIKAYQSNKILNDLIKLHHSFFQFMNIQLRNFIKVNINDPNFFVQYVQNLIDNATFSQLGPTPEQSQLIKNFYSKLNDPELLNSFLDAPLPNIHLVKFNVIDYYTRQQLSNKTIDKYDISLREIFNMLINIKNENETINSGQYLACYDITQSTYENVLYLEISKKC